MSILSSAKAPIIDQLGILLLECELSDQQPTNATGLFEKKKVTKAVPEATERSAETTPADRINPCDKGEAKLLVKRKGVLSLVLRVRLVLHYQNTNTQMPKHKTQML